MWKRIRSGAADAFDVLRTAASRYGADRAGRMAAAIAYRTIFALAPLLLVAVAVFGAIVGDSVSARQQVLDAIATLAGSQVREAVRTLLDSAVQTGDVAAVIGFALFVWTASSLFMEIQNDLNDIFGVPYESTTGVVAFVRKRGIGFLWSVGLGLVLTAVWAINLAWQWFGGLFPPRLDWLHGALGVVTPLISLLVFPVLFGLILQTMTKVKLRWRTVWFGGLFISAVFVVSAIGTGLYFSFDSGTSASRVAGAFFVVLLLAFVLSSVFLYGAEVTKVYSDRLDAHGGTPSPEQSSRPEEKEAPASLLTLFAFLGGLVVGWRRNRR